MDLPLSHLIRLTLSDVSVIFGWSRLRFMDSRIVIPSGYMSDLLCILIELLMSYQDGSGTSDTILGHIPSFSYGDDHFLTNLLQFSSFGREMSYLLYGSLFWWCSSRWVSSGTGRSGCHCLAIHDSSVDCCIEITMVTLSDHFSGDPLVDHSIWSSRLASRAPFDTYGVFSDPFDGLRAMWHATLGHIFPHHSLAVQHSELPCLPSYDIQSRPSHLDVHGYLV